MGERCGFRILARAESTRPKIMRGRPMYKASKKNFDATKRPDTRACGYLLEVTPRGHEDLPLLPTRQAESTAGSSHLHVVAGIKLKGPVFFAQKVRHEAVQR
eukprot:710786-Hanusia_phi.AAC.1